jgi:hypothetical protein
LDKVTLEGITGARHGYLEADNLREDICLLSCLLWVGRGLVLEAEQLAGAK